MTTRSTLRLDQGRFLSDKERRFLAAPWELVAPTEVAAQPSRDWHRARLAVGW